MNKNQIYRFLHKCNLPRSFGAAMLMWIIVAGGNTLLSIPTAHAQENLIIPGTMLEKTLGNVLKEFRAQSEQVLISGEVVADRQIRHAANIMLILTRELELALAGQLDKALKDLNDNVLHVVNELEVLRVSLLKGEDDLVRALDEAALDIERIVGNTIFANYPFLLKRIGGFHQLYNPSDKYKVNLTGSGFGSSQVAIKKFIVAGHDAMSEIIINRPQQNFITAEIDPNFLNVLFDTDEDITLRKIKVVPVDLTFERTIEAPWWRFWNSESKRIELDHQFYMYLIPNYAGQIVFDPIGDGFEWRDVGEFSFDHRSKNNHCQGDCDTDDRGDWPISQHGAHSSQSACVTQSRHTPPIENDQYLRGAAHSPSPGYNIGHKVGIQGAANNCLSFEVLSRTHAHTYKISARLMQYVKLADPVSFGKINKHVEFGKTYTVAVSLNTRLVNYSIDPTGPNRLMTGQLQVGVKNHAFHVLSNEAVGGNRIYTYRIPYPGEFPAMPVTGE